METVDAAWVAARWPVPQPHADKYARGVVGIVAGSEAYPGAAVLACSGAMLAGVGVAHYIGPRRAQDLVLQRRPEVIVHDPADAALDLPHAHAWVIGPGVVDHAGQEAVMGAVLASGLPVVVDAGALVSTARTRAAGARAASADAVLMTPHESELVRALAELKHSLDLEDVRADRVGAARLLAEAARTTVLLKGSLTLVASPGGTVRELPPGPSWLATAGTGDVLAGVAGALMAAGLHAAEAGAVASWVHAQAGQIASGGGPVTALGVAEALPRAVAALLASDQ